MTDFPSNEASPPFIHTYSRWMSGAEYKIIGASNVVGAYAWAANTAVYMPMCIPWPYPVRRLFWINGSTASSNVDIGIYREDGSKVYSKGSTAQSGASVVQYVTPATPFVLPPGRYFLAWNCDGTTARAFGIQLASAGGQSQAKTLGFLSQAVGAITLPSPATFAAFPATIGAVVAGITRLSSGF